MGGIGIADEGDARDVKDCSEVCVPSKAGEGSVGCEEDGKG